MTDHRALPHLPGRHLIDAYGNGGFRFGHLSHRGSILCLPSGVYAWPVCSVVEVTEGVLAPIVRERNDGAEILLLGTGLHMNRIPDALRWSLRAHRIGVDAMDTGSACRTYNIMLGENRPVAAALIAVD